MACRLETQSPTTTNAELSALIGILTTMKKSLTLSITAALILPALAGCTPEVASSTSEVVFVGMMGAPKVIDPAGTRSSDDAVLLQQIFPSLLNSDGGVGEVVPELGVSAEYTSEFEFKVELKPDLKFSNGHALTASDVVHSIDRIKSINDPNGPAVLLGTIESVAAIGDTTVVFKPTRAFDQALPGLLAGLPGLVVDEEVFPADRLLSNGDVAGSNAFAGPYTLAGYSEGSALRLNPNPAYAGLWGVPQNKGVEVRFYSSADQLMFDSSEMVIDVAIVHHQSLTASTGQASEAFAIDLVAGPNVETGMLLVNGKSDAFTFGGTLTDSDATDVRSVFIDLLDEQSIVRDAYGQLYPAAEGLVPANLGGVGKRGRDILLEGRDAVKSLNRLGIKPPIQIELSYPESFFGPSVAVLVNQVKTFVDDTRAFEVTLKPLSDDAFLAARESLDYDVLFDYHYPLFADAEAFLFPLIAESSDLGANVDLIGKLNENLAVADSGIYRDHESSVKKVESQIADTAVFAPLLWAGRQALVRDGIIGSEEMLGKDGKLVLAKLYRNILK